MRSPFPGMDPYLENSLVWPNVHFGLIHAIQVALVPAIAPRYYVSVDERTYINVAIPDSFIGRPDLAVIERFPEFPAGGAATAVLDRPMVVELPMVDHIRERYLEIRATENHELITVIEILSPSNKQPGEGRRQYEKKREQVFETLTNLVEIDLLRGGAPLPMGKMPRSHYRILISREWERPRGKLYPFNLPEAIPEIPIPLRRGEAEPMLALNDLLAQVYAEARYDLRVNYTDEPDPPLDAESAKWVRELIQAK